MVAQAANVLFQLAGCSHITFDSAFYICLSALLDKAGENMSGKT
jgi:hypothetical protein